MYAQRTVSVRSQGRVGVGFVVAPGLVLTAFHAVRFNGVGLREPARIQVLSPDSESSDVPAELAWHDGDAALLRFAPAALDRDYAPVRWGELTCTSPAVPARCFAVGLPRAAIRTDADSRGELSTWRAPETAEGHVNVVDNASRVYSLQVDGAASTLPASGGSSPWDGLSGAGLVTADFLIGVVTHAAGDRGNRRLEAIPVRVLLDDREFCDLVEQAGGTRPRLEPADLEGLFEAAPQPVVAASYLLAPRAEAVRFTGMDTELQHLRDWCTSPDPAMAAAGVAVVEGPGGTGKTRLAVELARRLSGRRPEPDPVPGGAPMSWSAGFLDPEPREPEYAVLLHQTRPLLLIVDYAEYRQAQVEQLLKTVSKHRAPGLPIRILLLVRSCGRWWDTLRARYPAMTAASPRALLLSPETIMRQADPDDLWEQAALGFRQRIADLHHAQLPDTWDPQEFLDGIHTQVLETRSEYEDTGVMSLHMDILAQVLLQHPEADDLNPTAVLLAHEAKHWERAIQSDTLAGLNLDCLQALVAVQRLAGAEDETEALATIRAVWESDRPSIQDAPALHPNSVRVQLRILRGLYPPTGGAYWGGLKPDALMTALLDSLDYMGEEFLTRILVSECLSPRQRRQCLNILSRSFTTHPYLMDHAATAVAVCPDLLMDDAVALFHQLPLAVGTQWRETVDRATLDQGDEEDAPQLTEPTSADPADPRGPHSATARGTNEPAAGPPTPPPRRPAEPDSPGGPPPQPSAAPPAAPTGTPVPRSSPRVLRHAGEYLGFDSHTWRWVMNTGLTAFLAALITLLVYVS